MDGKGEKVRNILVTGADGFIGSHLCESLVKKGFKVRALSQYNSFNFWGHLEKSSFLKDMEVISGDLRDSFFLRKNHQKYRCDLSSWRFNRYPLLLHSPTKLCGYQCQWHFKYARSS